VENTFYPNRCSKPVLLAFILTCSLFQNSYAQSKSSRNGFWLPVKDSIRILLVFAEVTDDPNDNYEIGPSELWQRGELPRNAAEYFDPRTPEGASPKGYLTDYFAQASFGQYIVIGDYYPELLQIPYKELQGNGDQSVLRYLNNLPGEDIVTASGLSVNAGDFDKWSGLGKEGAVKPLESDSLIDMVMVMWRFNSRLDPKPGSQGSVGFGYPSMPIKGMKGSAMMSRFLNYNSQAQNIIRHEYAHGLFGGNNFHTNGGHGDRVFMDFPGGFSMLSESDRSADTWNAWDRHRLGWKHPDKQFLISGMDGEGNEIPLDLQAGDYLPEGLIYLRDFVSSGDALRIELPYVQELNEFAPKQYLWLENRQKEEGNIDVRGNQEAGIYAFIQVGKDDTASYGGASNYIRGLQAFGNYDFEYLDDEKRQLSLNTWMENPFTGYNMLGRHPVNRPGVGGSNREDLLVPGEWFMPEGVVLNGNELTREVFNFETYPLFGTAYDAFLPGDRIHIGGNPAATPVLTWQSMGKGAKGAMPRKDPIAIDNRLVPLNGIAIQIVEQRPDGAVGISIEWDDWKVDQNRRWAGPLVLFDTLIIDEKTRISLEQGLSAQQPFAQAGTEDSNPIFAEPTFLKLMPGSVLIIEKKARFILRDGSRLIEEDGSQIILKKKAAVLDKN
jgi:hypothetical protein